MAILSSNQLEENDKLREFNKQGKLPKNATRRDFAGRPVYIVQQDVPSIWMLEGVTLYGKVEDYNGVSLRASKNGTETKGSIYVSETGESIWADYTSGTRGIGFVKSPTSEKFLFFLEEENGFYVVLPDEKGLFLDASKNPVNAIDCDTREEVEQKINQILNKRNEEEAENTNTPNYGEITGSLPVNTTQAQETAEFLEVNFGNILRKCGKMCQELMDEDKEGNHNTSPLSIAILMGMLFEGLSNEQDKESIAKELGYSRTGQYSAAQVCNAAFKTLYQYAKRLQEDNAFEFGVGNAMASDNPQEVQAMQQALKCFDIQKLEMNPEKINSWVKQVTKGMIKELDLKNVIKIVINAIALKASWETRFNIGQSGNADFKKADGGTETVMMMNNPTLPAKMFDDEHGAYLELPYKGGLKMIACLPHQEKTRGDLTNIAQVVERMEAIAEEKVNVYLPRFRIQSKYDVTTPFNRGNFGALSSASKFGQLDRVQHGTYIHTNEKGSEAGGSTSGELRSMSFTQRKFNANRPFAYYIVSGNNVLFEGRVAKPGFIAD